GAERVGVLRVDVPGQRDDLAGADERRGRAADLGRDQVERAEPVIVSPPSPVGQGLEVPDDFFRAHASPLTASARAVPKATNRAPRSPERLKIREYSAVDLRSPGSQPGMAMYSIPAARTAATTRSCILTMSG